MVEIIHLIDAKGIAIDSVPVDYEDAFTLEPFKDLCNMYNKVNKSFIIARVATMDPKQPLRMFFSYYDGYQMNKILFQTQRYNDKRLLHRLFVLNPLTNADIIGDVEYFKVHLEHENLTVDSPKHPNLSMLSEAPASPLKLNPDAMEDDTDTFTKLHNVVDVNVEHAELDMPTVNIACTGSKSKLRVQTQIPDIDSVILNAATLASPIKKGMLTRFAKPVPVGENGLDPTESEINHELISKHLSYQNALQAGSPSFTSWVDSMGCSKHETVDVWRAEKFGTDEDFLRNRDVRHFFRNNALRAEDTQLYQMPDLIDEEGVEDVDSPQNRRGKKCLVM